MLLERRKSSDKFDWKNCNWEKSRTSSVIKLVKFGLGVDENQDLSGSGFIIT